MGTFDNEKQITDRAQRWLDAIYGAGNAPAEVVKALSQEYYFIHLWGKGDLSPEHVLQVCREIEFRRIVLDAVNSILAEGTETKAEELTRFTRESDKVEDGEVKQKLQAEADQLKQQEEDDWRNQH